MTTSQDKLNRLRFRKLEMITEKDKKVLNI